MKVLNNILFLFVSIYSNINAQVNLVANGGFEEHSNCPFMSGQLSFATGWFQPNNIISVFSGSTDYFNSCAPNSNFLTPNNYAGTQSAKEGTAYADIITYSGSSNGREYIESKLKKTLKAGNKYCLSFHVSLSDTSTYASNNIGVYFSTDTLLYSSTTFQNIPVIPHINVTSIISDKKNWTMISGEYTAQGGENFITIGNFYDDASTTFSNVGSVLFNAYYYIDDVSLVCCDCEPEVPNIFSPNGDGVNDLLEIQNMPEEAIIKIYDRWGVKVFESNKQGSFWDGRTTSGVTCNEGVYYYIISTPDDNYRGCIQLVK